ncbi:MAG TPA: hypothetical protein VFH48_32785 [Chloroflexota bacterium]|nr:hypothetical protein [Chloroflexota bacterium]
MPEQPLDGRADVPDGAVLRDDRHDVSRVADQRAQAGIPLPPDPLSQEPPVLAQDDDLPGDETDGQDGDAGGGHRPGWLPLSEEQRPADGTDRDNGEGREQDAAPGPSWGGGDSAG